MSQTPRRYVLLERTLACYRGFFEGLGWREFPTDPAAAKELGAHIMQSATRDKLLIERLQQQNAELLTMRRQDAQMLAAQAEALGRLTGKNHELVAILDRSPGERLAGYFRQLAREWWGG
jgi:hypothetical protein